MPGHMAVDIHRHRQTGNMGGEFFDIYSQRCGLLLGAVATCYAARGRGLASACVTALTHDCLKDGKKVYISPKNDAAATLYARLGFVACGEWGKVQK